MKVKSSDLYICLKLEIFFFIGSDSLQNLVVLAHLSLKAHKLSLKV